jgi:CheY-like chemotaxis protein
MASAKTVLVVDDDPDVRNVLTLFLQAEGFRVATAADGLEALEYLHRGEVRPDLILLDLAMPRMGGVQFRQAQLQNADLAKIPVVVVSASTEAGSLGVPHFCKPVPFEQLLEAVKSYCGVLPGPDSRAIGDDA